LEKTLAFVLGGTIRGVIVGFLIYVATIFFVGYEIAHPVLFILSLIAISFIFSSLGMFAGLQFANFEKLNFVLAIILTPLVYFGGVFFGLSKLPGVLSNLIYVNPLFPLINTCRSKN
jgi:ABC-2 type transport system permease protein